MSEEFRHNRFQAAREYQLPIAIAVGILGLAGMSVLCVFLSFAAPFQEKAKTKPAPVSNQQAAALRQFGFDVDQFDRDMARAQAEIDASSTVFWAFTLFWALVILAIIGGGTWGIVRDAQRHRQPAVLWGVAFFCCPIPVLLVYLFTVRKLGQA